MSVRGMGSGGDVIPRAGAGSGSRKTFAVGRLTRQSAEILLAEGGKALAGPFVLKAVVQGVRGIGTRETVH